MGAHCGRSVWLAARQWKQTAEFKGMDALNECETPLERALLNCSAQLQAAGLPRLQRPPANVVRCVRVLSGSWPYCVVG